MNDIFVQQQKLHEKKLKFKSLPSDTLALELSTNVDYLLNSKFNVAEEQVGLRNRSYYVVDKNLPLDPKAAVRYRNPHDFRDQ